MLSISAAYRNAMANSSKVVLKATLRLASGTTRNLVNDDFMMGTATFSEGVSSDGSFDIGAAIMGKFDFSLNNTDGRFDDYDFTGATVTPYVGVELGSSTEWLLKGYYNVEQPNTYGPVISVSALDNLSRFERNYSDVNTTYPASLQTIVRDICTKCGVVLANANFPNASYSVTTRPDDDAMTCLDMVSYVAQMAGCWARCDEQGRLSLGWYNTSYFDSQSHAAGTYADLSANSSMSVHTDDVVITGVRVTAADQVLADGSMGNKGETSLYGNEGYVIELSGNPLCLYGKASTSASFIGNRTVGMTFRPFDAQSLGNPAVQAGDPAIITDAQGRTYNSYVTSLTYKVGSYESYSCGAEYPGRNKSTSYSAVTKAFIEARNEVRREQTAREAAIEELAHQLEDSSGLYMTKERQQDGSYIYYMHDKPTLAESQIVWKLTANAFGISTDGGQTYPYGLDVNGDAILNRIYAIGLDADYIDTGRIAVTKDGRTLFMVDMDTGTFLIQDESGNNVWDSENGFTLSSGGRTYTIDDYVEMASKTEAAKISVGGTNLLNGSGTLTAVNATSKWKEGTWRGASGGTGTRSVVDAQSPPNNNITRQLRIVGNGTQTDVAQDGVPVVSGESYLLACYAKGTGTLRMQVGSNPYLSTSVAVSGNTWKRYYMRFTAGQGDAGVSNGKTNVYFGNIGTGTLDICGMKLERGNKCTDWSPSPDDDKMYATERAGEAVKTAEETAGKKATDAINQAKRYTNEVSATDRAFSESQRKALDASLNQAGVLKRLTNNYSAKGIFLKNGELYVNGTYVRTGTLDAGIIKAGILTDKKGRSKWNMATGYLETKNMVANNANVTGQFSCGSDYIIELKSGQIRGYQNRGKTYCGFIDYSATTTDISTGRLYKGLQITTVGCVRISTPRLAMMNSSNTSKLAIFGWTGKKKWNVVSKIQPYGNGGVKWWTTEHGIECINGIVVSVW